MLSGEQFKRLRLSRGLSLNDIANYIGKTKQAVSMFENFKWYPPEDLYNKMLEAVYKTPSKKK